MHLIYIIKYIFFSKLFYIFKNFLFVKKVFVKNFSDNMINGYVGTLKKDGYVVINNFFNKENCKLVIEEINNFYKKYPNKVWLDKSKSEYRIHGAEKISINIKNFFINSLSSIVGAVCFNGKLSNLMTMANRIVFTQNNLGSGGGWHRDDVEFQFKAILYLVDVNENNGPFQLIKYSNKLKFIIRDCYRYKMRINETRLSEKKINEIINAEPERLKTITGSAGTLILVDTSLIHRGRPLASGLRYALTNYYYPSYKLKSMQNHFLPKVEEIYY
jgi:ectoine hydroxylase-related dioxygenase (phytanoyl-CoA dioxygenase family)